MALETSNLQRPSPRRQLALRAVAAVRAFKLRYGKPPTVALPAVAAYQATVPWPTIPGRREADGVWGSTTRRAAARDLGVALSELPLTAWSAPYVPIRGQPGLFRSRR
jgi:hypothetical protein